MNGRVYEPLPSLCEVLSYYGCTISVIGSLYTFSSQKLPSTPSAAYSKQLYVISSEVPYIPITRVEYKASKRLIYSISPIPTQSQAIYPFLMTTSSMDEKRLEYSHYLGPSLSQ
ncbi:unnamed protein product [Penicillium roqueforti FM164]|uniref:Genomic scaffold, ProqFM164S02 n=1 Tax=Penicillium roqueforti (strain FM164) TaxID=1365484 RepID=W6Q0V0_PENRF|nr:unnamed protein product [Penicillium roqueforti FM164]